MFVMDAERVLLNRYEWNFNSFLLFCVCSWNSIRIFFFNSYSFWKREEEPRNLIQPFNGLSTELLVGREWMVYLFLWSEVFDQSVGLVLSSILCDLMEWNLVNKSRTVLVDLFYRSELFWVQKHKWVCFCWRGFGSKRCSNVPDICVMLSWRGKKMTLRPASRWCENKDGSLYLVFFELLLKQMLFCNCDS